MLGIELSIRVIIRREIHISSRARVALRLIERDRRGTSGELLREQRFEYGRASARSRAYKAYCTITAYTHISLRYFLDITGERKSERGRGGDEEEAKGTTERRRAVECRQRRRRSGADYSMKRTKALAR